MKAEELIKRNNAIKHQYKVFEKIAERRKLTREDVMDSILAWIKAEYKLSLTSSRVYQILKSEL